MARTEYKFQYLPLEGRLPGKVMEQQTEDAINDLGIWLVDVSETADSASTLAQDAYDRAVDAQSTADKAQSAADNAQSAADEAVRAAGNAQSAGDQAQTSADEAMAAAKAAQESAGHAQESADKAQETADTAQESADKAQETADNAQDSADAAQTAADAALASLSGHVDDTDNPHQVTAAQLGLAGAYVYRGTVDEYADLPEDAEAGDVYNVVNADEEHGIKAGDNVAWTGENWDNLSGIFDTSGLETEISEVLQVANNAQEKATEAVADIGYQDSTLTVTKGDGSEKQFTIEGGLAEAVTDVVLADNTLTVTGSDGTGKEYSIDCTKAEEALTLAETANSAANTAIETANTAQTAADEAKEAAESAADNSVNDVAYSNSTLTVTKGDGTEKRYTIESGGGDYLPITGGTMQGDIDMADNTLKAKAITADGDIVINGLTITSGGHIILPSGVEFY